MALIEPLAPTIATAVAPVPSPVIVTVASGFASGLFAQFAFGPK